MYSVISSLLSRTSSALTGNGRKKYPQYNTLDKFLADSHIEKLINNSRSLDLGCGSIPRNPFQADQLFGVDLRNDMPASVRRADLSIEPIPWSSSSFDFLTAFDFIEHIPRHAVIEGRSIYPFICLMSEIFRVLNPGGLFLHSTPAYPSKVAFQDPTHLNIITEDTFPTYFCLPCLYAKELGYGFSGSFDLVKQAWIGQSIVCLIRSNATSTA